MLRYIVPYLGLLISSLSLSILIVLFDAVSLWFSASLVKTLFIPDLHAQASMPPALSVATVNEYLKFWTYHFIARKSVFDTLKFVCLAMASAFLLKNAGTYIKSLVITKLNLAITRDMRNDVFSHSLQLPVTYYDRNNSGRVISLVLNDVSNINASITGTFDNLLTEPFRVLFFIGVLLLINIKLSLIVFIVFPVLGYLITVISRTVRRRSKRMLEKLEGLVNILYEAVSGIRIVKMFNMHEVETGRFKTENSRFVRQSFGSTVFSALSSPLTETLGVLVAVILLWYGGRQVLAGKGFSAEDFVRFLFFLFMIFKPLKTLSGVANSLQSGFAAAERVFAILDTPREPLGKLNPQTVPAFTRQIRFAGVSFTYPGTESEVLHDISLTIRKGDVLAIVGSSGGGKSTLLDLLPRFYEISRGVISLDDTDIRSMDLVGLRHLFGIVSQETTLFNDTVFNNIAYGVERPDEKKVIEAATAAFAWEFIEKMPQGLHTIIGERGVMLSGGQRQRLAIARALLKNPPVLILDEATSALDTESERSVQHAINNLMRNRTVLVVAHRLSTIQHATSIVVLDNGAIIEQGSHEELLRLNKKYKYFYDIQFAPVKS
ncbi:MAG: ABC transporter transmembrane domain-containing protein [Chitinivibrionales bacterium]|nr:ABC transporter transmembrane domain-containing protein [Chitinivibrionales bacterium]